ncbi:hypothetical protein ACFYZE_23110 [Streptomyces sp. NPDC001796]|uniref:hypothetical protein n=1 Tax=Streptomyces sp. NPDC001796 TaxID=3364609 RepID=UPI003690A27F
MTEHGYEGPGETVEPVPRDMPDQQAHGGEDRWDARPAKGGADAPDVPDTDEAGTGRQGAPHAGSVHPEGPVPDESPD